ncbi:MAG: radical SAM peptide maturase [Salinivirgaceae bacterium]|nr:radical SAM peptide maturase [Salinivirgaceae bacterium]
MNSSIIFKSSQENNYLYSTAKKQFFYLHPILEYIYNIEKEGINIPMYLKDLNTNIDIDSFGSCTKENLIYYYDKYLLYRQKGYFGTESNSPSKHKEFTGELIKKELANSVQILFEVTNACNLNCTYCGYSNLYEGYDKREDENLDIDSAKKFIDYMITLRNSKYYKSLKKNIAISFYGGEPLLNFKFIEEIVQYTRTKKHLIDNFEFWMTTNGVLLNKYMDFLAKEKFKLMISLDGDGDQNSYRVDHGNKNSFDRVYKNISLLKEKHSEYFENTVTFNTVLHDRNSIKDVAEFFNKEYGKIPNFSPLTDNGIREDKKEEFNKIYKNFAKDSKQLKYYPELEQKMHFELPEARITKETLTEKSNFSFKNYNELLGNGQYDSFYLTGTCIPFSKSAFVLVNGKILPCEQISHQFELGRINKHEISINFDEIAQQYNKYFNQIAKQCKSCIEYKTCKNCIFQLKFKDGKFVCHQSTSLEETVWSFSKTFDYLENNSRNYKKLVYGGDIK